MSKKTIRTLDELTRHQLINPNDLQKLEQVVQNFSLSITSQMHELMDKSDEEDPIAKQFVPSINELTISDHELNDPIGDHAHTAVKGIVHRYPDRCLFTPVHVCPVYCRFCFRKEQVANSSSALTPIELEAAFEYLAANKNIWEVILTGGDPLILKPSILAKLLSRLAAIEHIEVLRIHTRIPVVESHRINANMIDALKQAKPVYIFLHANHPKEFTPQAIQACASLVEAGIPMLSQTVLLKDLNDNIEVLSELMRCFIKNRIKPHYLHHGDLARGTGHFRTTIEAGQRLVKQLRGRFSGLCQPTYVLDLPGGYGKIPLSPQFLKATTHENGETHYQIEDYQGQLHTYIDRSSH